MFSVPVSAILRFNVFENTELSHSVVWLPVFQELRSVKLLYLRLAVLLSYVQFLILSDKYRLPLAVGSL